MKIITLICVLLILSSCASTPKSSTDTVSYSTQSYQKNDISTLSHEEQMLIRKWEIDWKTYKTIYDALKTAKEYERQWAIRKEYQRQQQARREKERQQEAIARREREQKRQQQALANRKKQLPECSLNMWDLLPIPGPWKLLTLNKMRKIYKMRKMGLCK
jgi:hypothetical protein